MIFSVIDSKSLSMSFIAYSARSRPPITLDCGHSFRQISKNPCSLHCRNCFHHFQSFQTVLFSCKKFAADCGRYGVAQKAAVGLPVSIHSTQSNRSSVLVDQIIVGGNVGFAICLTWLVARGEGRSPHLETALFVL